MALWKKILATVIGVIIAVVIIVGGVFAFAYHDFSSTVEKTYKPVQRQNSTKADSENQIENSQPFSMLFITLCIYIKKNRTKVILFRRLRK